MFSVEQEITKLEEDIKNLKIKLFEKERQLYQFRNEKVQDKKYNPDLSKDEIARYSRQMMLPQIGVTGQISLKNSKVIIIGIGGLGCPAALYLAAAGVGEITLVDYDEVEITNLHRQVLHSETTVGQIKVESAFETLTNLNSNIKVIPLHIHADSLSLQKLISEKKYEVVIDGSDNVATRYLLNDICVLNNIPLVSGSALQMEGQLTVYNYQKGPCYRCLFPKPPPPHTVTSCGDGGVLGVVPGTIGILEALEAIKIIIGIPGVLSGELLLFDAEESSFRKVKLRFKNPNCDVCGSSPTVTQLIDYEQFCGAKAHDKVVNIAILDQNEEINITDFSALLNDDNVIIDVRSKLEYEMCHLPHTVNVPFNSFHKDGTLVSLEETIEKRSGNVYVMCRRGNDSQRAISVLKDYFVQLPVKFINVTGGLHAYAKVVDNAFPVY